VLAECTIEVEKTAPPATSAPSEPAAPEPPVEDIRPAV
jgi:hypothetical protein